jgi:hypothetical protein
VGVVVLMDESCIDFIGDWMELPHFVNPHFVCWFPVGKPLMAYPKQFLRQLPITLKQETKVLLHCQNSIGELNVL